MKVIDIHPITQTGFNSDELFFDGRPCFSPDGNTVLFERRGSGISLNQLWTVDIHSNLEKLHYKSRNYGCLRASWSWNPAQNSKQIAFTGMYPKDDLPRSRIMLLDENGANNSAQQLFVPDFQECELSYPAWCPNELNLLLTNYTQLQLLKASIVTGESSVVTSSNYWSGMGTVNPTNRQNIAFAGQPKGSGAYDQQKNRVLLQVGQNDPVVFSDPGDEKIGRAPWFSPDGTVMAFEAHPADAKKDSKKLQIFIRKIDLQNPQSTPIIPVSDKTYAAQHAKFSPDGSKLVWAQNNGKTKEKAASQLFMGTVEY